MQLGSNILDTKKGIPQHGNFTLFACKWSVLDECIALGLSHFEEQVHM